MTDDQIQDLKDFISVVVRTEVRGETAELKSEVSELKSEVSELKQTVADIDAKVDTIVEAVGMRFQDHDEQLSDHKTRITRLERLPSAA